MGGEGDAKKYYEKCCYMSCTIHDGSGGTLPSQITHAETTSVINGDYEWKEYTITADTDNGNVGYTQQVKIECSVNDWAGVFERTL